MTLVTVFRVRYKRKIVRMSEIVVAFTTVPEVFDVVALARELVGAKVAACVTVLPPVESIYEWEGTITVDRERQLLIKTTRSRISALWEALSARHPYDVPEFLVIPVEDGHPAYLKWVEQCVGSPESR